MKDYITKTKQKPLKLLSQILIVIALIVCAIAILLIFLLKRDDTKKENYELFLGGITFDYANNIRDNDMAELKWLELYCQSDGSISGGKYYEAIYEKDINSFYHCYDIDSFTLSGREITINFEKQFGSVRGTFNDSWTSITFIDTFPPIYSEVGWRFDIREKT